MSGTPSVGQDYVSDVLDEIALEGLDGITIEALWKRLSVRQNFCLKIDENTKNFLWRLILQMTDVRFYELPEARSPIKYYDYSTLVDNEVASLELDEIYPYSRLKFVEGVLGSCKHYSTRRDITDDVIKLSLIETEQKWGNKLVIVASQDVRCSALFGNFCSLSLDFYKNTIYYDILERLGRARYLGLTTCGKASLLTVIDDSKSIFHYLKVLMNNKLIKKQPAQGTTKSKPCTSIVHLSRFYEEILNDNLSILQTAIEELKMRPHHAMPCTEFYELFSTKKKSALKKFKKSATCKKYLSISKYLPYRTFFPDANQSEWERKSKNGERIIRCVQLINPDVELGDIFDKECDPDDDDSPSGFLPRGIYFENMPVFIQALHHIKNAGAGGMSQRELIHKMGVCRKFARALIKRLTTEKYCKFVMEYDGRRRLKKYFVGENRQTKEAASEIAQILLTASHQQSTENAENVEENAGVSETTAKTVVSGEKIHHIQDENVPYRTLRRIGMIMKLIKTYRIRLFHQIVKYINEEEIKEGLTSRVDRLTINRILVKLEKDGLLKMVQLKENEKDGYVIKLYADPTFEPDENQMKNLCHINYSYGVDGSKTLDESSISLENYFSTVLLENMAEMKKLMGRSPKDADKVGQVAVNEGELVYSPKFIRLNILHELVFHLVYDYTGVVGSSQEALLAELSKTTAIDDDLKKEMPNLYATQLSSYMFVPPLNHTGQLPGWFLISDIIIRMPLSVIVKILKVNETCPELWSYLHHPIRRHFLVKDLPIQIRQLFFNRKNNIGSLFYEFKRLCFIGLLQFGVKFGREVYQTFLYLNRRASLLDTSKSPAGYYHVSTDVEFETKSYYFETKSDVQKYWMDMFNICLGTNLGVKTSEDKGITAERELVRENLRKVIEPKGITQVVEDDNGSIPGDRLGAAGLDSAMFSFLRSNWTVPIKKSKEEVKKQTTVTVLLQRLRKERIKKKIMLRRHLRKRGPLKDGSGAALADDVPKVARFKKVKDRECNLPRRKGPSYDEMDLEALKIMNTLRVTWSAAEDNLLLICRVAMLFLCPNSRTFLRIPWAEIRRVLQENCPESRNKTQKAIARRIVYMLKNPTTVRSVNLCLEELRELPEASEKFDCSELLNIKPSTSNLTNLQNVLYQKFHELVAFLKDRFLVSTNFNIPKSDKDLIPDSLNEFLDKYQFDSFVETSITVKSIRENVIRAILMSSLSCRSDKTSSAAQLFDIYRQYNDDELQNAVKNLYNDKVIILSRKAGNSDFKSGKILPLSFTPYKLSFAFKSLLSMKFAHSTYHYSFSQITKLLEEGGDDFEVDLNECNIALFLLASKDVISFRTIIPEQIIILDGRSFSDATYSKMLDKYCEMLRFSGSNMKVVCSSGKIITVSEDGDGLQIENGEKRTLADVDEIIPAKKPRTDEDCAEETTDKSAEDASDDRTSEDRPGASEKDQAAIKSTRSSRIILYMMREEAKKEANNDLGKMAQEFYVVNAAKVLSRLIGTGLDVYSKENGPKAAAVITKQIISRASVPINLVNEELTLQKFTEDTIGIRRTLDYILSKKEIGATIRDLVANCDGDNLHTILRYLLETKVVLKVGITETRFVSQNFCTPWLLNSYKMTRLEREKVKPTEMTAVSLERSTSNDADADDHPRKKMKGVVSLDKTDYVPPPCSNDVNNKIKIIIRPWIRIDGSLNRKVLDRFLGAVLGHVMVNPGVTIANVMKKFSPAFTPVWTKDLIEILFDIGCVTFTSLVLVEKASLFTESVVRVLDCYTGFEEDDCVAVEAKIDAITTLGLFIGKKTYTKDFLLD